MKNYVGVEGCDDPIRKELEEAGIEVNDYEFMRDKGEVKTSIIGQMGPWSFQRAWTYWTAEGNGIPPLIAEEFHKIHGEEVRVEGHCGCPSPLEYNKGFAVGSYHIDTQEGLNAFAALIRKILADNS